MHINVFDIIEYNVLKIGNDYKYLFKVKFDQMWLFATEINSVTGYRWDRVTPAKAGWLKRKYKIINKKWNTKTGMYF